MTLRTFLDYYKPLDSVEKIDKLFDVFFKNQPIRSATTLSKILDVINEDIKPYFYKKKAECDNRVKKIKKLKRKAAKKSRCSPSVYNKDEIVYKRIRIISTAM